MTSRFGIAQDAEYYYIGPDVDGHGARQCAGTMDACIDAFGRLKFDLIINEFCPVSGVTSAMGDILHCIHLLAKSRARVLTPLIPKAAPFPEALDWDAFRDPTFGAQEKSWLKQMRALGFEVRDYDPRTFYVLFAREKRNS